MSDNQKKSNKLSKTMITMCSAAIGTIYLSAYWVTASTPGSESMSAFAASSPTTSANRLSTSAQPSLQPVVTPSVTFSVSSPSVGASPAPTPTGNGIASGSGVANPGIVPSNSSNGATVSNAPAQSNPSATPVPTKSVATATPKPSSANQVVTFKDGTYTGQGSNRIGGVEVAVTIKKNKITSVQITRCTTRYPQSRIDHLPQQVLDRQTAKIDVVSGATLSTQDFQTAVEMALAQARS